MTDTCPACGSADPTRPFGALPCPDPFHRGGEQGEDAFVAEIESLRNALASERAARQEAEERAEGQRRSADELGKRLRRATENAEAAEASLDGLRAEMRAQLGRAVDAEASRDRYKEALEQLDRYTREDPVDHAVANRIAREANRIEQLGREKMIERDAAEASRDRYKEAIAEHRTRYHNVADEDGFDAAWERGDKALYELQAQIDRDLWAVLSDHTEEPGDG